MFNVLPDIFKKEIKSEYYLRRLIVVFAMIVFVEVVFLVSLFPSLVFSAYRQKEISAEMASNQSDAVTKNTSQILQTINVTNQNLDVIDGSFDYPAVLPLVENIISYKTSAITLTDFNYDNSAATTTIPMSISGVAATREDLVALVKNLEDSPTFSDVVSPISDLTKDKNIDFIINFNATP